jgi:hypothetical protein
MVDRTINSIAEFIEALRQDQDPDGAATWFRGHSKADWKLLPGLMRDPAIRISETTLLTRFKQSAAMLTSRQHNSSFDWMFSMQHYGVPTRLLDWSENPLVALFFSVEQRREFPKDDGAVWCLRPTALNRNAGIRDKTEAQYIPSFEGEELESYSTESVRQNARMELFPVATIATRNNPRIQAQMGTFTIHHHSKIAIEDVGDKSHVSKYVIPNASREIIFKELKLLGLTRFSLFPELESVGSMIREMVT